MILKCIGIGMFLPTGWEGLALVKKQMILVSLNTVLLVVQCDEGALSQVYSLLGRQDKDKLFQTERLKRLVININKKQN